MNRTPEDTHASATNPRPTVRPSDARGKADFGWLDSRHSFSFGEYHDPAHMGFRSLRVINQDRVAPRGGFPTHPHRNMEIFSYVLEGALEHRDSMGNRSRLEPGQIQLMSAGSGVTHSEYNPSASKPLRFLQIWIQPRAQGLEPTYTEWSPTEATENSPKTLLISPDGRDGSAVIHQDASVYRLRAQQGTELTHTLTEGRGAWLQVITGTVNFNGVKVRAGDGASIEVPGNLSLTVEEDAHALLFDLA